MFDKLMAKFGHGGAKVDLVLPKDRYEIGEQVEGQILVQGGKVEQTIRHLKVQLKMEIGSSEGSHTYIVTEIPIPTHFVIHPHEQKTIPFQFTLPLNLPLSGYYVSYYFATHLDIEAAVDHTDKDFIYVEPNQPIANIFNALQILGLQEKSDSREFDGHRQEFEFYPPHEYQGKVEEIEFTLSLHDTGVMVHLEVDKYAFLHEKEIRRDVYLENHLLSDVSELATYLKSILDEIVYSENASSAAGYYGSPTYHSPSSSSGTKLGVGAAVGSFAAGVAGGMLLNELLDNDDDDDQDDEEVESFFGDDDDDDDDMGGFFDDED